MQVWWRVSKGVLCPNHPCALHQLLFAACYAGWDADALGPPPAWVPTPEGAAATNAAQFMGSWRGDPNWLQLRSGDPAADWGLLQRISWANPEAFWPHVLRQLHIRFHTPPHRRDWRNGRAGWPSQHMLAAAPNGRQLHPATSSRIPPACGSRRVLEMGPDPDSCVWLPGARLNIAHCALTGVRCSWVASAGLHASLCCSLGVVLKMQWGPLPFAAAGRDPDRPAIVWADEAAPQQLHSMSLGELAARSAHVAEGLRALGLKPGGLEAHLCGMNGQPLQQPFQQQRPAASIAFSSHIPACLTGSAVAIDMPLTADAVAIYLGIVLAGCVAVSIADSFAAREIAARTRIARTQAIFTQARRRGGACSGMCGGPTRGAQPAAWPTHNTCRPAVQDVILRGAKALPLYAHVVEAGVARAIVLPAVPGGALQVELREQDLSWARFLDAVPPPAEPQAHAAGADALTGVIFSSGTTGAPRSRHVSGRHSCPVSSCFHGDLLPRACLLPARRRSQGHPLDTHHAAALRR